MDNISDALHTEGYRFLEKGAWYQVGLLSFIGINWLWVRFVEIYYPLLREYQLKEGISDNTLFLTFIVGIQVF